MNHARLTNLSALSAFPSLTDDVSAPAVPPSKLAAGAAFLSHSSAVTFLVAASSAIQFPQSSSSETISPNPSPVRVPMHGSSTATASFAKNTTDDIVGKYRRGSRLNADLMRKSRDVFPVKTAHHLADITGYSVRACERWLSDRVVIPGDALASLLQSEWGREFLSAVMTDNTPRWWLQLKAWIGAVDLASAERKHRRKLRELLDDANQAPGAAAMLLQDEDFYSGQPYPARALAQGRRR